MPDSTSPPAPPATEPMPRDTRTPPAKRLRPLSFWTLVVVAIGVGIGWGGELAVDASRPGDMITPWVGGACLVAWAWSVTRHELASWNICVILAFWMIIAGYILPSVLRETVGYLDMTGPFGLIRLVLTLAAWPVSLLILYVGYHAFRPFALRFTTWGMLLWTVAVPAGRVTLALLGQGAYELGHALIVALIVLACGLPLAAAPRDPSADSPPAADIEDAYHRP